MPGGSVNNKQDNDNQQDNKAVDDLAAMETEICALAGQIAAATSRFLKVLAKFDELGGWAGPGLRSCAHWLSWKCGMSLHTAREHLRVARALDPLPKVRKAFGEGRVSYSKVRSLTRVATPENEERLVKIAVTAPAAHLDRLVAGMKKVARLEDPAPQESRFRATWRWDVATGEFVFSGRLSAHDGAALLKALEHAERERNRTTADTQSTEINEVPRPLGDFAPALLAMAGLAQAGTAPAIGATSEVIFINEDESTRVHGGPALDTAGADEVLCESQIRRAKKKRGCIVDFGRTRRVTTSKQLIALIVRDGGCRTPGCGRTKFLHAHHVRFWGRGGRTDLDNLILLCGTCHRALHKGAFSIVALGDQQFEFRDTRGRVIPPAPPIRGHADKLWDPMIRPTAIVPDWGGEPMRVAHAVSVLLDEERRPAA